MPTLLLIRHGENEYTKSGKLAGRLAGVHLNQEGKNQALQLATTLQHQKLKAVYASPLSRTMETAQAIAEAQNLEPIAVEGLQELNFGEWQGKSLKQLSRSKLWHQVQTTPSQVGFPGGETFMDAQVRMVNTINSLLKQHKAKDCIACVGHSDMIKLYLTHALGLTLDNFQRIVIHTAAISTIHIEAGQIRVINMNVYPENFKPKAA